MYNIEELLKGVTKEQIEKQRLSFIEKMKDFNIWLNEEENTKSTLPIDLVREKLKKDLGFDEWQAKMIVRNNVDLIVIVPLDKDDLYNRDVVSVIRSIVKSCGYFYSRISNEEFRGKKLSCFEFHPVNQVDVSSSILESSYGLYHWTPRYKYDEILRNGSIVPKAENPISEYPPRIYCISTDDFGYISDVGRRLCDQNNDDRNNNFYILLDINKEIIKYGTKFYYDPDCKDGYYTTSAIPVAYILKTYINRFI